MQPLHQTSDRLMAEARLGPDRLTGAYPWRSVWHRRRHGWPSDRMRRWNLLIRGQAWPPRSAAPMPMASLWRLVSARSGQPRSRAGRLHIGRGLCRICRRALRPLHPRRAGRFPAARPRSAGASPEDIRASPWCVDVDRRGRWRTGSSWPLTLLDRRHFGFGFSFRRRPRRRASLSRRIITSDPSNSRISGIASIICDPDRAASRRPRLRKSPRSDSAAPRSTAPG
jgi:hypothetical protein